MGGLSIPHEIVGHTTANGTYDETGLDIYDPSDAAKVKLIGSWPLGVPTRGAKLPPCPQQKNLVLLLELGGGFGLHFCDFIDPLVPQVLSHVATNGGGNGVVARDGRAFYSSSTLGQLLDVSDPLSPKVLCNWLNHRWLHVRQMCGECAVTGPRQLQALRRGANGHGRRPAEGPGVGKGDVQVPGARIRKGHGLWPRLGHRKSPAGWRSQGMGQCPCIAHRAAGERIPGRSLTFRMSYDAENLYLLYEVRQAGPFKNTGNQWDKLFKTGARVDLMIACDDQADPARRAPANGDKRLLLPPLQGKPIAVLYDAVNPQAPPGEKWEVVSSVARADFDSVKRLEDVRVAHSMIFQGEFKDAPVVGYIVEAAVPLKSLGLKIKADTRLKLD